MTGTPLCPRCDTPMVLRTNRKTGEKFFGCQKFPDCRGTRPYTASPKSHQQACEDGDIQCWECPLQGKGACFLLKAF